MDGPLQNPYSRPRLSAPVRKVAITIGPGVERLGQLASQLVFFTPAPLYIRNILTDAVLGDFLSEEGRELAFFHRRFERPIFRGLELLNGDVDWNHVLWALRAEDWLPFERFVGSAKFPDSRTRHLYAVGVQSLTIFDPYLLDQATTLPARMPLLAIKALGINGSHGVQAFEHLQPWEPPRLRRYPADPRLTRFASIYFQGKDPSAALEGDPVEEIERRYREHPSNQRARL